MLKHSCKLWSLPTATRLVTNGKLIMVDACACIAIHVHVDRRILLPNCGPPPPPRVGLVSFYDESCRQYHGRCRRGRPVLLSSGRYVADLGSAWLGRGLPWCGDRECRQRGLPRRRRRRRSREQCGRPRAAQGEARTSCRRRQERSLPHWTGQNHHSGRSRLPLGHPREHSQRACMHLRAPGSPKLPLSLPGG